MPGSDEILRGLAQIANEGIAVAAFWHAAVALAIAAWLLGAKRPSPRLTGVALALPLASVSVFAWAFDNPFNGSVFAVLAAALALLPRRWRALENGGTRWNVGLGWMLIAFGWFYPHFLEARTPLAWLYGAPLGLIPCPTLSLVIGVALLGFAPGRAWTGVLAAAGVFYALFGALRLEVTIDWVLLAGAAGLVGVLMRSQFHPHSPFASRSA